MAASQASRGSGKAPLPAMAVAQVHVKPDGANGHTLERERQVNAPGTDEDGRKVVCRFRTTSALPLVPLVVTDVELMQPGDFPPHITDTATLSALRVRVVRLGSEPVKSVKTRQLRFYIDPTQKNAYYLQELLAVNLVGMSLLDASDTTPAPAALPQTAGEDGQRAGRVDADRGRVEQPQCGPPG